MKKPPFLFAVQRQVGGVHVKHDLGGSRLVRLDEHADQQFIHRLLPEHDFLVAVAYAGAQLQPVQRTLAARGSSRFRLPASMPNTGSVRSCSWSFGSS